MEELRGHSLDTDTSVGWELRACPPFLKEVDGKDALLRIVRMGVCVEA